MLDPGARTVSNQEIDPDRTLIYTLRASRVKLLLTTMQLRGASMLKSICFSDALTFREFDGPNRRGRPRRYFAKTAIEDCWRDLSTAIVGPGGDQGYHYPTDILRINRFAKSATVNTCMHHW